VAAVPSAPVCDLSAKARQRAITYPHHDICQKHTGDRQDIVRIGQGQIRDPAKTALLQLRQWRTRHPSQTVEHAQKDRSLRQGDPHRPRGVHVMLFEKVDQGLLYDRHGLHISRALRFPEPFH